LDSYISHSELLAKPVASGLWSKRIRAWGWPLMRLRSLPSSAHAWAMTIAIIFIVEAGYHIAHKEGPLESYISSAMKLADQRLAAKFTPSSVQVAKAAPQQQQIVGTVIGGNLAQSRLFKPVKPPLTVEAATGLTSFGDPFVEKLHGVFIPHPFSGYVGVQSAFEFRKDFFGYRNDEDMYFDRYDPKTRPEILITWSGNSEAAGLNHATTVPEFLERVLNARDRNHRYKALNLATAGYALNDEMAAYVGFAYALKPEFSITHSGITDVAYGGALPGGFKKLGLIYTFDAYYRWVDLIYNVQLVDSIHPNARRINPDHMEDLIPGILKTYDRFRSIIEGNRGELVHGLPPNNATVDKVINAYSDIWLPQKLQELHDALPPGSFIDLTQRKKDVVFHDSIHTETEAAKLYAEIYAEHILRRVRTRKLAPTRKGADLPPASECRDMVPLPPCSGN
jgi:hypothetical protein